MGFIVRFIGKDPLPRTLCIWLSISVAILVWAVSFASESLFLRVLIILKLWTLWMAVFMVYCMRQEKKDRR